jgi:HTH-type transcriptional regulator, glycine betaine synthesis regulator
MSGTTHANIPAGEEESVRALPELQERFVLHWGEMASAWGIPRTMGQIHALLYVSPEPLSTDEIMERLQISRGNASMNLRSLEDWGVIHRVHFRGERREYFRAVGDAWELFLRVVLERKRREFDPMMRSLSEFLNDARAADGDDPALRLYRERLGDLLQALELIQTACDQLLPRDPSELPRLLEARYDPEPGPEA